MTSRTVFEVGEQRELVTLAQPGLVASVWRPRCPGWAHGPTRPRDPRGLAGSSPLSDPLVGSGHTWPSPCSVSECASSNRHAGAVMPRDGDLLVLLLEWMLPVLGALDRGVFGIYCDHHKALVEGHASQSFPEAGGGDTGHGAAERLPACASAHGLPADSAGVVEAQVLHRDPGAAVLLGDADQLGDRGAEPSVPLRGGARHLQRHGDGVTDGVAVRVEQVGSQVIGVQVNTEQAFAGCLDLLGCWQHDRIAGPRGIQVPAVTRRGRSEAAQLSVASAAEQPFREGMFTEEFPQRGPVGCGGGSTAANRVGRRGVRAVCRSQRIVTLAE